MRVSRVKASDQQSSRREQAHRPGLRHEPQSGQRGVRVIVRKPDRLNKMGKNHVTDLSRKARGLWILQCLAQKRNGGRPKAKQGRRTVLISSDQRSSNTILQPRRTNSGRGSVLTRAMLSGSRL